MLQAANAEDMFHFRHYLFLKMLLCVCVCVYMYECSHVCA